MQKFSITILLLYGIASIDGKQDQVPLPTNVTVSPTLPAFDDDIYNCAPHTCTDDFEPICSFVEDENDGELVEDFNRCYHNQRLQCTKQLHGDSVEVTFLHEGLCGGTECLGAIPRIYKPVCSSVNDVPETDDNKQKFELKVECAKKYKKRTGISHIVRYLHAGECFGTEEECWQSCPTQKEPVCSAVDGYLKTQDNRCIFDNLKRCSDMSRNIAIPSPMFDRRVLAPPPVKVLKFLHDGVCNGDELKCPSIACKRDLRPVCSSVNGRMKTEANLCTLQSKQACDRLLKTFGRTDLPLRRLRYRGACAGRRRRRRSTRRRRTRRSNKRGKRNSRNKRKRRPSAGNRAMRSNRRRRNRANKSA